MKFELTPEDMEKVMAFKKEQDEIRGSDNYGAIGGALTYLFTPTGLGDIIEVKHATGAVLDLTNVDDW